MYFSVTMPVSGLKPSTYNVMSMPLLLSSAGGTLIQQLKEDSVPCTGFFVNV